MSHHWYCSHHRLVIERKKNKVRSSKMLFLMEKLAKRSMSEAKAIHAAVPGKPSVNPADYVIPQWIVDGLRDGTLFPWGTLND